jgi:hypothetical protein
VRVVSAPRAIAGSVQPSAADLAMRYALVDEIQRLNQRRVA